MIGVTSGMQYLHRDLPVLRVHRFRNLPMPGSLTPGRKLAGKGLHPARTIRCIAASNDQADVSACTLREIDRQALVLVAVFEPCVHGTHEHPVL